MGLGRRRQDPGSVDRGNPCGKRDYAIIMLIPRLGLRTIDVKRLEFPDFEWPGCRLSVAQAKTGRRVQLPLLKDVGWAVIDYVRAGRPASSCRQVFLRHTAPVGPSVFGVIIITAAGPTTPGIRRGPRPRCPPRRCP